MTATDLGDPVCMASVIVKGNIILYSHHNYSITLTGEVIMKRFWHVHTTLHANALMVLNYK